MRLLLPICGPSLVGFLQSGACKMVPRPIIAFKKLSPVVYVLRFLFQMYDFSGDVSTTYTGEFDNHLSGILATYNRLPYLPQWEAPCNALQGSSDGTKFPTGIKNNETIRFFRKSLCRSMPLVSSI